MIQTPINKSDLAIIAKLLLSEKSSSIKLSPVQDYLSSDAWEITTLKNMLKGEYPFLEMDIHSSSFDITIEQKQIKSGKCYLNKYLNNLVNDTFDSENRYKDRVAQFLETIDPTKNLKCYTVSGTEHLEVILGLNSTYEIVVKDILIEKWDDGSIPRCIFLEDFENDVEILKENYLNVKIKICFSTSLECLRKNYQISPQFDSSPIVENLPVKKIILKYNKYSEQYYLDKKEFKLTPTQNYWLYRIYHRDSKATKQVVWAINDRYKKATKTKERLIFKPGYKKLYEFNSSVSLRGFDD